MTHITHARTVKALESALVELAPLTTTAGWRLYDAAHDATISYTYGLPRAVEDAARVVLLMRTTRHPDLAVWEEISTTIIKERLV